MSQKTSPNPIRTEDDLAQAVQRLDALWEATPGRPEWEERREIIARISAYEAELRNAGSNPETVEPVESDDEPDDEDGETTDALGEPDEPPTEMVAVEPITEAVDRPPPERPRSRALAKRTTPAEKSQRRRLMLQLLMTGRTIEEIEEVFQNKYAMKPAAVRALQRDALIRLVENDDGRAPYKKLLASQRLLTHIRKAADDANGRDPNFGHVASLEKVYCEVEGLTGRITGRTGGVSSDMNMVYERIAARLPPERIAALAAAERARLSLPASGQTIDVLVGKDI